MGSRTGILVAAVVAAALAAGAAPAAPQTCPHPGTVKGISVLVYCGSAKATVKLGATTIRWKNGQCLKVGSNFYVNIGDIVTQPVTKAPDSFQVVAGTSAKPATKDGSYPGTTVMMSHSGHGYLADALVLTLTHGTKAGTLKGTIASTSSNAKYAFHASFSC